MLPDALTELLSAHRNAYALHYPPHDNSDHGPMTYLAMHGLGIDVDHILRFARTYSGKLAPLSPPTSIVSEATWQQHRDPAAYSELLAFFDAQIATNGWQATVRKFLPVLISGWVKDAFHPLIRLGYGIEFEAPAEIAAGLAYLTSVGADTRLFELARQSPSASRGRSYFQHLQAQRRATFARGPFNARYEHIIKTAALHPAAGPIDAVLVDLSRACLEIFHATHDFFALHLVTASHAFRICSRWGGDHLTGIFSVGLATAYLAIGAPSFQPVVPANATLPIDALAGATDEHDIKLAYSCHAHAQASGDSTYRWCAANYLGPRLSRGR